MKRLGWWIAGVLLLGLIGLGVGLRLLHSRPRFVPDADLMEELATVAVMDDPLPTTKDWPQWRGPGRDGVTSFDDLLRDWSTAPKTLHSIKGGEGYSSFAVRDGLAWTMVEQGGEEAVLCFDLTTGKERWRYPYRPVRSFDYGGPRATPALAGDRMLTVSSDGVLLCLGAADGKEKWKSNLGRTPPRWGFACSPLIEGDHVITTGAFDLATGKKVWDGPGDPVGYSSPIAMTIDGVRQVVFFTGTRLVGVSAKDGAELWSFKWDTQFQVNAATPLPIRTFKGKNELHYLFISSGYEKGCALVKIAREDGSFTASRVYESSELCCHFASPVRHGANIYGLDERRDLTCLDLRTGKVAWRQRGFRKGSLIRVDDLLVVLGENGDLALVDTNPTQYVEIATARPFRDRCWATPTLADGKLLLRDRKTILWLDVTKR